MADDRYSWLDEEAAELLLRGQPVAAHGVKDAERLAEALDGIAMPRASKWEMPGEAAAVAAFREARPQALHSAGLTPRPARNQRALRLPVLARPMRLGLTVALAGCALGGVAVAVTTGVLPTPFGGSDGGLKPASSTAHPESPNGGGARVTGGGESRPSIFEEGERARSTGPEGSDKPHSGKSSGSRGAAGADRGSEGRSGSDGAKPAPAYPPKPSKSSEHVVALCKSYANDDLDRGDRKRLESAAGGAAKVPRYCQRHGGGSGSSGGSGSTGGSGDSGGGNDSGGDRGSDGDEKADGADRAGRPGGGHGDRPGDRVGGPDRR